jgi:hypothetical protein
VKTLKGLCEHRPKDDADRWPNEADYTGQWTLSHMHLHLVHYSYFLYLPEAPEFAIPNVDVGD